MNVRCTASQRNALYVGFPWQTSSVSKGCFGKNHKNHIQPLSVIHMNTKLAITISLIALLCVGFIGAAFAQTRVPGVKGQDYMVYSITTHWNSENATEAVPDSLVQLNQTTQYKVQIGGITNVVNVTATNTWDFNNGTQYAYLINIDVESGTPYYLSGTQPPFEGIVGANLNAGDLLHPAGNDSLTINQTITKNYAGGARQTNIVDLTSPIQNQTLDSNNQTTYVTIGNQEVDYQIDRATGILVLQNTTLESFTPRETASIIWTLKETNLWDSAQPADLLLPIIAAAVIAVVVVVAVVYLSRRKGHRKKR
jgi:hypothetical protein